jgi:hypothetical protein
VADAGLGATVMPEALRKGPEEAAPAAPPKRKRERKPPAPPKAPPAPKPAREPSEGERSKAFPIAIAAAALIAIVLGFMIGGSGGGDSGGGGGGGLSVDTASAGAAVTAPSDFAALSKPPEIPGLGLSDAAASAPGGKDGGTAVVVGTAKDGADNSVLLAPEFMQALGDVPKRSGAVALGSDGLQAYRYDNLKPRGFDRQVTVFAAPTTEGVATVACVAPAAQAAAFAETCDQIANTLSVSSGEPVPVGPNEAYAAAVSKAFKALNAADKSGQAKLKSAKTPQAQAVASRALAAAYGAAAKALGGQELSPADGRVNSQLVVALRDTSGAYKKAAGAAAKKDKAAFKQANGDVQDARADVGKALKALKGAGYDVAT